MGIGEGGPADYGKERISLAVEGGEKSVLFARNRSSERIAMAFVRRRPT